MATNLYGTGIDDSLFPIQALGYGIFGDDSFASTGVRRHQNAFVPLYREDGYSLERIELEFVFAVRLCGRDVLGNWSVMVSRRHSNLMSHLG